MVFAAGKTFVVTKMIPVAAHACDTHTQSEPGMETFFYILPPVFIKGMLEMKMHKGLLEFALYEVLKHSSGAV